MNISTILSKPLYQVQLIHTNNKTANVFNTGLQQFKIKTDVGGVYQTIPCVLPETYTCKEPYRVDVYVKNDNIYTFYFSELNDAFDVFKTLSEKLKSETL